MTLRRRDISSFAAKMGHRPILAKFTSSYPYLYQLSRLLPSDVSHRTSSGCDDALRPRGCPAFPERCDTERRANPSLDRHEPSQSSAPEGCDLHPECRRSLRTRWSSEPLQPSATPSSAFLAYASSPAHRPHVA